MTGCFRKKEQGENQIMFIPEPVKRHFAFQLKVKGNLLLRLAYLFTYYTLYLVLGRDHAKAIDRLNKMRAFQKELMVRLPNGARMVCTYFDIFIHIKEIYADDIYGWFPLKEGAVVLDVGAQIGSFSVKSALEKKASVVAFEPFPVNFKRLTRNIELNSLAGVKAINMGLWNESGEMKLYIDELSTGGHSMVAQKGEFVTVRTAVMDKVVEELGLKSVDLIKIDTEGAEIKILEGAKGTLLRFRPFIIMETHNTEHEVKALLEGVGYAVTIKDNYLYAEPKQAA